MAHSDQPISIRNYPYIIPLLIASILLGITIIQMLDSSTSTIKIESRFRDPASYAINNLELDTLFIGLYSQIGSMLWLSGATITLFSAFIIYLIRQQKVFALVAIGLVGFIMGLDDLLLFHELVIPSIFGISERRILFGYGLIILVVGFLFGRQIWQYDKVFFILAALFFVGSVVVDLRQEMIGEIFTPTIRLVLEDGLKFLGITCFWTGCLKLSYGMVAENLKSSDSPSKQP